MNELDILAAVSINANDESLYRNNVSVIANAVEITKLVVSSFVGREISKEDTKNLEEIVSVSFNNAVMEKVNAKS